MRRSLLVILMAAMVGALLPASSAGAVNGSTCWSAKGAERRFATKMNEARSGRNLRAMRLDPELSKVARVHSKEMVRAGRLHHTPTDALTRRVTNWVALGENVGEGPTVASLHRAFMDSPAHKANILNATYNHVGVGTKRSDRTLWVTVVFEARTDPGTTLSMPRC